jgi:REP element-mobilizing transposase RayT
MPDHVHTVVRGSADDSELLGFAKLFKQLTGYHLKTSNESTLWQQSYHDRLLYTEDEVSEAVEYVLNNPLTDGLAQTRGEYRWVGGSYAEHG